MVSAGCSPAVMRMVPAGLSRSSLNAVTSASISSKRGPTARSRRPPASVGSAIALFLILLASNAAWSWMFFWAHSPLLGLVNIIPQLIVILATIVVFAQLDILAVICFVPLAAWVGFASVLNIAIWRLNS